MSVTATTSSVAYESQSTGAYSLLHQLDVLQQCFPELKGDHTRARLEAFTEPPPVVHASELWVILPHWEKLAATYNQAVDRALAVLAQVRPFHNYHAGSLGPSFLRQSEKSAKSLKLLAEVSKDDFFLLPIQTGRFYRSSAQHVRRLLMYHSEVGLGVFAGVCHILTHPQRFCSADDLHMDLPGDEYRVDPAESFSRVLSFGFFKIPTQIKECKACEGYEARLSLSSRLITAQNTNHGSATGLILW